MIAIDFIRLLPLSKDENRVTYKRIFIIINRLIKYARFILIPANTNI
jgi:hypothetical protein